MAKKSGSNALLLDTHILLWLSQGDPRLPESAQIEIEKASRRKELCLSVITLWEIGYLVSKERIKLSADLPTFWEQVLTRLKANELEINSGDVVAYHSLPEGFHGDPGDRFLVAQARSRGLRMMTADGKDPRNPGTAGARNRGSCSMKYGSCNCSSECFGKPWNTARTCEQ